MRTQKGGVAHVAATIEDDLRDRDTKLHKGHIIGLSDLAACALTSRNANTGEWLVVLPRVACSDKAKEHYISRFLANKLIKPIETMQGYIPELMEMQVQNNLTIILMMDQSKIADGFECLMISMRVGQRAIPVAWQVVETQGPIGFDIQEKLLNQVLSFVPLNAKLLLAADRFYGTSSLVAWCQRHAWQYRIRLKGNLIFMHAGGEMTPIDGAKNKLTAMTDAKFNKTNIITNIGIIWETGHKEPWFIAMNCAPTKYTTLDYGMRWGIECMFSDFKSRGFSITKTKLKHPDRIERLILVLTIALFWAVSTGMQPKSTKLTKKNSAVHYSHSLKPV